MLKKIEQINVNIKLLSGMHIGGSSDTFDIGGADSTVIKDPLTKEPYIPGSSIKGKIRSLLTQKYGTIQGEGNKKEIKFDTNDKTAKIVANLFEPVDFGNDSPEVSRAIFRDAFLTDASKNEIQKFLGDGNFTEIKGENSISLLNGKAANPRFIERVPAGAEFSSEIILQIYDGDNEQVLLDELKEALKTLELNYIGASGTRGYGKVKIDYEIKEVEI